MAVAAAGRRSTLLVTAFTTTLGFAAFSAPSLLPAPAHGQDMQQPEVENAKSAFLGDIKSATFVRSGPSENFYPTLKLEKGAKVTVVGIKYNWLKIEPPKGSFSYVAKAFVKRHGDGAEGVVDANANPNVRAGSDLNAVKTTVQTKLQPGQHVKIVGEQDEYFKIEPPAGAYLYVDQQFVNAVAKIGGEVATNPPKPQPKAGDDGAPPAIPQVDKGSEVATNEPGGPESPATGPATRNGGDATAKFAARIAPIRADQALAQRRESGRHHQHVLLFQHAARRAAARRPDALAPRLVAHLETLGGVLIGPDMAPQIQLAEFGMAGENQRRQLGALADLGGPALDLLRDRAGAHRIDADFVKTAELARFELWRERRRDIDLALLIDDEFARVGRPAFEPGRLGALASAFFEVLIGPDMDNLVQRTNLGVPERG